MEKGGLESLTPSLSSCHSHLRMFILIDGMTTDAEDLPAVARRVPDTEHASGVTAFAVMGRDATFDGSKGQKRQLADHTISMTEASYDELLEWLANSTVAMSNSNTGERIKMEDPTARLEPET